MSEPEPGFPEGARSPGSAHGHAPAPRLLQPAAASGTLAPRLAVVVPSE